MGNKAILRKGRFILFVICALFAVIYWPHNIFNTLELSAGADIRVTVIISDASTPGYVQQNSSDYSFQSGSEQYANLIAVLSKYAYHESLHTLRGELSIESTGNPNSRYRTISISDSYFNIDLLFTDTTGPNALINKNLVQVGYWGRTTIERLIDDIIAICRESGADNNA